MIHQRETRLSRCADAVTRTAAAFCLAILVPFALWGSAEGPLPRLIQTDAAREGTATDEGAGQPLLLPPHSEAIEAPRLKIGPLQVSGSDAGSALVEVYYFGRAGTGSRTTIGTGLLTQIPAVLLPYGSRAPPVRA